jgi:hypothetical protein
MNVTEKNGQPSMEEILASIRRIIAEEPSGTPQGIEPKSKSNPAHAEPALDEHSDFELPSIFRVSSTPTPEKHTPLLGRLTEAIRGAAGNGAESRAAKGAEERPAEQVEQAVGAGRGESPAPHYPTLSSLKSQTPDHQFHDGHPADGQSSDTSKPAGPTAEPPLSVPQVSMSSSGWKFGRSSPPPAAVEDEIKRVMVPFKDTRFQQMAVAQSQQVPTSMPEPFQASPPGSQPGEPPRRVDFTTIIPARMGLPGVPVAEQQWRPEAVAAYPSHAPPTRSDPAAPPHEPPRLETLAPLPASPLTQNYSDPGYTRAPLPATYEEHYAPYRPPAQMYSHDATPTGTIEDTTAELLRPMLRQWLADNMPRMVEKALHIEVAESVKTGKKFTGQ